MVCKRAGSWGWWASLATRTRRKAWRAFLALHNSPLLAWLRRMESKLDENSKHAGTYPQLQNADLR
jgi:hypothetical protein